MNCKNVASITNGVASAVWLGLTVLENQKDNPDLTLQILYPICSACFGIVSYLWSPCGPIQNNGSCCSFFKRNNGVQPAARTVEGQDDIELAIDEQKQPTV